MQHSRRRFLAAASTSVAATGISFSLARAAQFEYKFGDTEAADHPINVRHQQWASSIRTETNGRLNISVFPFNALGSATGMLSQVRSGAIQFLSILSASYTGVVPVAAIDSIGFAFASPGEAWATMDGPLGAYVRNEFSARGLYAFDKMWEVGMRQITTSTHPIRNAGDLANVKLRSPPAKIFVDLFTTLGASPTPLDSKEMYTAMQTHLVDGQESPPAIALTERLYEVQKYLSLTSHAWAGHWMVANLDAWNALPPDIQAVVVRNSDKYARLERNDMAAINAAAVKSLQTRHGMVVNAPDRASMRAKLAPYYARWRGELGSTAWDLLEARVGKLA